MKYFDIIVVECDRDFVHGVEHESHLVEAEISANGMNRVVNELLGTAGELYKIRREEME